VFLKKAHKLFLLALIWLLCAHSTHVSSREVVRFAVHTLPGWVNQDCQGILPDIVKNAFKAVEHEVECVLMPQLRQVRSIEDSAADCAFPYPSFAPGSVGVEFTDPVVTFRNVLLGLGRAEGRQRAIGEKVIIGFPSARKILGSELKPLIYDASEYIEIPGSERKVKMLVGKRVDYIIGEQYVLENTFKSFSPGTETFVKYAFKPLSVSGACQSKKLVDVFNKGLDIYLSSSQLDRLHDPFVAK